MLDHRLRRWPSIKTTLGQRLMGGSASETPEAGASLTQRSASIYPVNTIHCTNVGTILGQRRGLWANIRPALGQGLVFTLPGGVTIRFTARYTEDGGPRIVVSTAAFHACLSRQSSGFGSQSRRFERNKNVSSPSTCETQYCGEPP